MDEFTADAVIAARAFTADAWILGERWRHHRVRDHFGAESDLFVVLSESIGPYMEFTPIHWVLADMVARIEALESSKRAWSSFSADAEIVDSGTFGFGFFVANAVILLPGGDETTDHDDYHVFDADAELVRGLTADAWIAGGFTANAFIILDA